ncbi:PPC domain-containing DNA-binding protein [Psychromicrobium xiongbiense]|uniref:PPC domain-containing DNA-binding protein n=1 Tax=Psychromicrobium xiongbiense TaxID=3051184 RepID=UPI0025574D59|nr:DUF296 domain-containing protein [Psychromicrobium sp. YIM S02556]
MNSTELQLGRRILLVLDPGDDVLESIAEACRQHGIRQASIPVFLGAFRTVTMIGTEGEPSNWDAPMPDAVTLHHTEGMGNGTVSFDADQGTHSVHLHAAVGEKAHRSAAYSGHVLSAETHYVAEIVLEELLSPTLSRPAGEYGVPVLHIS